MGTYLYGTKLIRTRTEPLRNKQLFIEYFSPKRFYFCFIIVIYLLNINPPFSMNLTVSLICKKCSLLRIYHQIDAISTTTDFKCIASRSEHLFRTCSVATSLVTSPILFLLCHAVVNTE